MTNQPRALTAEECVEIAKCEEVRQCWGDESVDEFADRLGPEGDIYAVHFDYMSGGPGYVGDYFIVQGDSLGEAIEIIRGEAGNLKIV